MPDDPKKPKVDSTLSKGLAILEFLADESNGIGVTDLSKELGLTKSNTFRLLQTLKGLGYVKHAQDRSYTATLKTWQVGRKTIDSLNLRDLAAPEMRSLSNLTQEAVYLAVRENLSVIYISKIDSLKPISSWNAIGGSAPIHCVATGKAILAANYTTLRSSLKGNLKRYTEKTITSLAALDNDMAISHKRGYAYDAGEFRDRIHSVGAAIKLADQEIIAALGISLPDTNLPDGGEVALGELVADAAAKVSARLISR